MHNSAVALFFLQREWFETPMWWSQSQFSTSKQKRMNGNKKNIYIKRRRLRRWMCIFLCENVKKQQNMLNQSTPITITGTATAYYRTQWMKYLIMKYTIITSTFMYLLVLDILEMLFKCRSNHGFIVVYTTFIQSLNHLLTLAKKCKRA